MTLALSEVTWVYLQVILLSCSAVHRKYSRGSARDSRLSLNEGRSRETMNKFSCFLLLLLVSITFSRQGIAQSTPGYDVFLLVGQSNMVGYGTGPDNTTDAAVSPRVFMWDANNNVIAPAVDPLVMNQGPGFNGLGLTFAKSYAASLAANRNVLLVGSATGGTGFYTGDWQAPNGPLAVTAVSRANAAMAAAGSGARFAGILWHQGEADDIVSTDPKLYAGYLASLISFFRTSITGASNATPFVVGEWTYDWMVSNIETNKYNVSQTGIIQYFHNLPDQINNTAWVNSAALLGDSDSYYFIHFNALSQRQLGRRYADRFFEAAQGLPQPQTSMKSWAGAFWDDGRSYNNGVLPFNFGAFSNGTVTAVTDPVRGNVAQISKGRGSLNYVVPSTTFNSSYTKMVWFKPGSPNYINNLISGLNPGQGHFLAASTFNGVVNVEAGHSDGNSIPVYINTPLSVSMTNWSNLCLVYDANAKTMKLYVNGALLTTAANVPPAPALTGGPVTLQMGAYGTTGDNGVDGSMAANRVWTSALTADQIAAIYNYELNYRAGW